MATYKNALLVPYTEESFTNWQEKVGAKFGTIAVDGDKLIKQWADPVDIKVAEKELRELGYTLGVEIDG